MSLKDFLVSHYSNLDSNQTNVDIEYLGATIHAKRNAVKVEPKSLVLRLSATLDFELQNLSIKVLPTRFGLEKFDFVSHTLTSSMTSDQKAFRIQEKSKRLLEVDLSDRHVYNQNFNLILKYSIADVGVASSLASSKYQLKVTKSTLTICLLTPALSADTVLQYQDGTGVKSIGSLYAKQRNHENFL